MRVWGFFYSKFPHSFGRKKKKELFVYQRNPDSSGITPYFVNGRTDFSKTALIKG